MTHTWRNADISNKVLNKRFSFFLGKLVRLLCIFCRKFLPFSSFKRTMVRYIHTYYDRLDKLLQSSMFATYEPLFRTLLLPCLHCAFPIANSVIESRSSSQRHQRGGGGKGVAAVAIAATRAYSEKNIDIKQRSLCQPPDQSFLMRKGGHCSGLYPARLIRWSARSRWTKDVDMP